MGCTGSGSDCGNYKLRTIPDLPLIGAIITSATIYGFVVLHPNSPDIIERTELPAQEAKVYRTAYKSDGSKVYDKVSVIVALDNREHSIYDRSLSITESNLANKVQISQ